MLGLLDIRFARYLLFSQQNSEKIWKLSRF